MTLPFHLPPAPRRKRHAEFERHRAEQHGRERQDQRPGGSQPIEPDGRPEGRRHAAERQAGGQNERRVALHKTRHEGERRHQEA